MKRVWLAAVAVIGFSLLNGTRAQAQAIASIGTQLAFEYGSNGRSFETRQPFALRGGYRFAQGDLYLEYGRFRTSQGSPMVQVERTHTDWLLWARRAFFTNWKFAPYAALGAGVQYEKIETTLGSERSSSTGTPQFLASAAGGFTSSVTEKLELQIESRLSSSSG